MQPGLSSQESGRQARDHDLLACQHACQDHSHAAALSTLLLLRCRRDTRTSHAQRRSCVWCDPFHSLAWLFLFLTLTVPVCLLCAPGGALLVYHLSHCTLDAQRPPHIPAWVRHCAYAPLSECTALDTWCHRQHVSLMAGAITGGMGALVTVQPPRTTVAITLGAAVCAGLIDRMSSFMVDNR